MTPGEEETMPFMIFCAIAAFTVQTAVLHCTGKQWFRVASLGLLELFPLIGFLYYTIQRPAVPYLGWGFGAAMCLWSVGAVLLGYLLAWGAYAVGVWKK